MACLGVYFRGLVIFPLFSFSPHPRKGLILQAVHTKLRAPREMLPAAALLPFSPPCLLINSNSMGKGERGGRCPKAAGRTEACKAKGSYGCHPCTSAKPIYINICNAIEWKGVLIPLVSFISPVLHPRQEVGRSLSRAHPAETHGRNPCGRSPVGNLLLRPMRLGTGAGPRKQW